MAAFSSLALWKAQFFTFLQDAFFPLIGTGASELRQPDFFSAVVLISVVSLAAAFAVSRTGIRCSFAWLGSGFLFIAALNLFASWFFSLDFLFVPTIASAALALLVTHIQRLWSKDCELSEKLIESSRKLNSLRAFEARARLISGLKLLDNMLSVQEAIVFQRDKRGVLISAARFRQSRSDSGEPSRNSTWREGISLCERAIESNQIITKTRQAGESATNVALSLRHENRTVGALLIRLQADFHEEDKALLSAVGAQLARNLQREETSKGAASRRRLAFLSTSAAEQRLESVYVLNGLLTEQRFGVNTLSVVPDGVAIAYLDGTLAYVNVPLLQLAQLTDEQARLLDFFGLLESFRTDVFDQPNIAVRRVLQTGESYERELHFPDRGETLGLRICLVHDDANLSKAIRQPLCLALYVRDLTRLKQYEQLKSDMISLMSHELRTPLTSINGFAELLTLEEGLQPQAKEFVTIISNESQRLSRMINTFLTVTQLQRKDKQEVLKIPLRLDEVVKEIIATLQPVAKKRRIRLVEQPTQRLPPVAADKSLISQAVKNLVSNAIKYSPERTVVTVSTALEAEAVRVCVEDRGYGIPAELRDRVWEKFYRIVREGQEKDEESTGLGLSFVREVVEQHGGTVNVDSEVGRGSKFSFTLPRL